MTLQQVINKLTNHHIEVAGSANAINQCTDLANYYIREVLGFPIIEWTDAKDFPKKAGSNYIYIKNTPTGVPQEGDLVIWSSNHIAIFLNGNANTFNSFDQNYPLYSKCHIQSHTYINVAGWLRPIRKENTMPASQDRPDETSIRLEYNGSLNRDAAPSEVNGWLGAPTNEAMQRGIQGSPERANVIAKFQLGQKAAVEGWEGKVTTLSKENTELKAKLATASEDTANLNAFGVALQWLLKRIGIK